MGNDHALPNGNLLWCLHSTLLGNQNCQHITHSQPSNRQKCTCCVCPLCFFHQGFTRSTCQVLPPGKQSCITQWKGTLLPASNPSGLWNQDFCGGKSLPQPLYCRQSFRLPNILGHTPAYPEIILLHDIGTRPPTDITPSPTHTSYSLIKHFTSLIIGRY